MYKYILGEMNLQMAGHGSPLKGKQDPSFLRTQLYTFRCLLMTLQRLCLTHQQGLIWGLRFYPLHSKFEPAWQSQVRWYHLSEGPNKEQLSVYASQYCDSDWHMQVVRYGVAYHVIRFTGWLLSSSRWFQIFHWCRFLDDLKSYDTNTDDDVLESGSSSKAARWANLPLIAQVLGVHTAYLHL